MTAKDWMTSAMCQSWKRWKVVSRIGLDAQQRVKSGRGEKVVTRMGLDDQTGGFLLVALRARRALYHSARLEPSASPRVRCRATPNARTTDRRATATLGQPTSSLT